MEFKEHQSKALLFSTLTFSAFLVGLYFLKIVYEPLEEPLAMGVDLNYGIDLVGYGNIQTLNKANDSKNTEEMAPSGAEETKPTPKPQPKVEPQPKEVTPKKTPQKQPEAKKILTSEIEKTSVSSSKETPKKATSTATTKPVTTTATDKPAPQTPPRSVDQGSIFQKKGTSPSSNGTVGTKTGIGGNNNGDGKPGNVGDQGSPQGTLDGKSLYGKPGSGGTGGASVSISGWKKRNFQLEKDKSNETGRIVFDVTVDDLGEVKSIVVSESNVSPSVTNFYKSYIQRKLSSFLVPDGTPPARATGRIIINLKSGN
jgi:periplasmic protein TonB